MTQLFLDQDGCLADFDRGFEQLFGRPKDSFEVWREEDEIWRRIHAQGNFFEALPPMPDLAELWEFCRDHNPIVLTGIPRTISGVQEQKRRWLDKHLGPEVPMIACYSRHKYRHGKPGDILVDDWPKYQQAWEAMGGIWITHTSARESIAQLKDHLYGQS